MNKQYYQIQRYNDTHKAYEYVEELIQSEYKVYELVHKRGHIVPYHAHAHQEVIVVLEGKMRMIIEEDLVDLEEGDRIIIEPFAIHLAAFPEAYSQCRFLLCFPKKMGV
ncbi:MAG: cupin domain-containing protein [Candidatus Hydrogenedentota bacterium]|nr:MAG: cupin domain-containing protein [Candidatus Hydrogenedentota bacterium]